MPFTASMKFLSLLVLVGFAIVSGQNDATPKLRREFVDLGDGTFQTIIERYDGSRVYQAGWVKNPEEEDIEKRQQVMVGFYSTLSNGVRYNTTYLSNENGYQVDGNHQNEAQRLPDYVYAIVDNLREGRGIGIPIEQLRTY